MAEEKNERSFGEVVSDVTGGILSGMANNGKYGALGGGMSALFNTDQFQRQKQKEINAAKREELDIKEREQRIAHNEMAMQHAKEDRPLERKNKEIAVDNANIIRNKNLLALQNAQELSWDNNVKKDIDFFNNQLKRNVGFDDLNFPGQAIFNNAPGIQQTAEAYALLRAFDRDPAEGMWILKNMGWGYEDDSSGGSRGIIISPDGKMRIPANDQNIRTMMKQAIDNMKNDLRACYALGADATSIDQFAIKNVLSQGNVDKVFGSYGSALGSYNRFLNQKTKDGKDVFSKEEKLGHSLARSLSSAILDGKISQQEQAVLTPLFAASLKKFGAEVIFGKDVSTSKIKLQDGTEVSLVKFAQDINQRDVIMGEWKNYVKGVAQQKALQQAKMKASLAGSEDAKADEKLSDDDLKRYTLSYGSEFVKLPQDVQVKIKKAENNIDNVALDLGMISKSGNGKFIIKKDATLADLKQMKDEEDAIFKKFGMESIAPRGQWNLLYQQHKAEEDEKSARKSAEKHKANARFFRSPKGQIIRSAIRSIPMPFPAVDLAAGTSALLGHYYDQKLKDYKNTAQKAKSKLENKKWKEEGGNK
jgi:hypothetical protein